MIPLIFESPTNLDIAELRKTSHPVVNVFNTLKAVFRDTLQAMLEAEMEKHFIVAPKTRQV